MHFCCLPTIQENWDLKSQEEICSGHSLTHSSWTTSFDKYALPGKAEDKMVSIIIFSKKHPTGKDFGEM